MVVQQLILSLSLRKTLGQLVIVVIIILLADEAMKGCGTLAENYNAQSLHYHNLPPPSPTYMVR